MWLAKATGRQCSRSYCWLGARGSIRQPPPKSRLRENWWPNWICISSFFFFLGWTIYAKRKRWFVRTTGQIIAFLIDWCWWNNSITFCLGLNPPFQKQKRLITIALRTCFMILNHFLLIFLSRTKRRTYYFVLHFCNMLFSDNLVSSFHFCWYTSI